MEPRDEARQAAVRQQLATLCGAPAAAIRLVRAPLRVCLLGAHIDHQLGAALGCALDQALLLSFAPRADSQVRLWSNDFAGVVEFDLAALDATAEQPAWGAYPRGVAQVLRATHGITRGLDGLLDGPLPVGGLSSSAAVDVACLLAFEAVNDLRVKLTANIELARRVENDCLGLRNGVLDQTILLRSQAGCLTAIDFLSGAVELLPTPAGVEFDLVVVHSGVTRALLGSGYNQRVDECRAAARALLTAAGQPAPADATLRTVPAHAWRLGELAPALARRATHFRDELDRVARGRAAWAAGDLAQFGRLMRESGESSIHNYECGSPQLVTLHEVLNRVPGVWGARFSGAGYGGAAVALAAPGARERLVAAVAQDYVAAHPEVGDAWQVKFVGTADAAEVSA